MSEPELTVFEKALCQKIVDICKDTETEPASEENIQLALCFQDTDEVKSTEKAYKKTISTAPGKETRQNQTACAFSELSEDLLQFLSATINKRFPAQYIKTNIVEKDIGDENKFSNLALFNKTITPDTFPLSPDIVYTVNEVSCILEVKYPHSNGHKWLYSTGFIDKEKGECEPINGFTSTKPFCAPFLKSGERYHVMGMKNEGSMITDLIRLLHINDALETGVNACLYFTAFFKCEDIRRCDSGSWEEAIHDTGKRLTEILRFYKSEEFYQCITLSKRTNKEIDLWNPKKPTKIRCFFKDDNSLKSHNILENGKNIKLFLGNKMVAFLLKLETS